MIFILSETWYSIFCIANLLGVVSILLLKDGIYFFFLPNNSVKMCFPMKKKTINKMIPITSSAVNDAHVCSLIGVAKIPFLFKYPNKSLKNANLGSSNITLSIAAKLININNWLKCFFAFAH